MVLDDEQVATLGEGAKRFPVLATVNGHTWRTSVARMGGEFLVGLNRAVREATGVQAGDTLQVALELDTAPREVTVPADLAAALDAEPDARRTFDGLSYSNKSWHVLQIAGAQTDGTRQRRVSKSVSALREGRPR